MTVPETNPVVRTRFAPSPTGYLHVGGIRTALFAWLVARQAGGKFILRIEDTDQSREVQGSADHIQECLRWLGLEWDEGPYFQSERLALYKEWAQKLVTAGHAYADPYTPEEVNAFRQQAQAEKRPFLYRNHRPEQPPVWDGSQPLRFRTEPRNLNWDDEVMKDHSGNHNEPTRGQLHAGPEVQDDFILMKSDGYPTYNFAHIIDDNDMGITHVIRGQEFLASMPNYLNLYLALGFRIPTFATVPHILGPEGTKKLSKRDGAKDILSYRDDGYLPEAMINFLASLGWNDGTKQEVFSVSELLKKFRLDHVQKSGARFDEQRLMWMNGAHVRALSLDELSEKVTNFWPAEAAGFDDDYKKRVLGLVQERLKFFKELPELTSFFFKDLPLNLELISSNKQLAKLSSEEIKQLLETSRAALAASDFSVDDLSRRLNGLLESQQQKPGILFSLIRIATTQAPSSPGLADTLAVIGKDRSLQRLDATILALG